MPRLPDLPDVKIFPLLLIPILLGFVLTANAQADPMPVQQPSPNSPSVDAGGIPGGSFFGFVLTAASRPSDRSPAPKPVPDGGAGFSRVFPSGGFLGFVQTAGGQAPDQLPAPKPVPKDKGGASLVFPEGGFPGDAPSSEGGLPLVPAVIVSSFTHPELHSESSEYGAASHFAQNEQEGPAGVEYIPSAAPLPDYYYRPGFYDHPGIGPRPLADYAPPGYEPREGDEGQAPGVPEFTPITPPPPISPEDRDRFVTRGMFPGSFLVPGTDTSFRLRGFVRVTALYDSDPIGSRDDFVTNTIPVPQQNGQNFNVAARYSRIGLDTWTPTPLNEWNVHTFIEADFFNGPAQAVGGGGNPFRLRFAFIDLGYFRIGQQNTVFMDGNAFPNTVDFAGPRGLINQRRPGFRMTLPLADNLFWAVGIEQPFSDITTSGAGIGYQDIPDVASHLRYEGDFGHVQLSSIVRSIGFQELDGDITRKMGWGFSASTVFHPWAWLIGSNPVTKANPTGLERSRILLQYSCGWGIGRYIQDTAGLGLDAEVDPATGAFDTLWAVGYSASYEHWFNEQWLTNITYSADYVSSAADQPGTTYSGAKYLAASLWWIPIRRMSVGIENVWGQRENLDTQHGKDNRINGLVQYNF